MATLAVAGDRLIVRLSGGERIGACSSDVVVPRAAVRTIRVVRPALAASQGVRTLGTGFPGVIALGRYVARGCRSFVAAYGRHPGAVVVELEGQRFDRLVVSSRDPDAMAEAVSQ